MDSVPLSYTLSAGEWTSLARTVRVNPARSWAADVCAAIQRDVHASATGRQTAATVTHLELVSVVGVTVRLPPETPVFGECWKERGERAGGRGQPRGVCLPSALSFFLYKSFSSRPHHFVFRSCRPNAQTQKPSPPQAQAPPCARSWTCVDWSRVATQPCSHRSDEPCCRFCRRRRRRPGRRRPFMCSPRSSS